jgi:hypothetical protein
LSTPTYKHYGKLLRKTNPIANVILRISDQHAATIDKAAQRAGQDRAQYILSWLPDIPPQHPETKAERLEREQLQRARNNAKTAERVRRYRQRNAQNAATQRHDQEPQNDRNSDHDSPPRKLSEAPTRASARAVEELDTASPEPLNNE